MTDEERALFCKFISPREGQVTTEALKDVTDKVVAQKNDEGQLQLFRNDLPPWFVRRAKRFAVKARIYEDMLRKIDLPEPVFHRASGEMVCEECGLKYIDHPEHPKYRYLRLLCQGGTVKT